MILYYKPTCPFSGRVLEKAEALGLSLDLRNVSGNETLSAELIECGGKRQTPYLVDPERGSALYESRDIIDYLEQHYGKGGGEARTFNGLRVHQTQQTCDGCE